MIKLLDCTLRDGGYINNWQFGYDNIKKSIRKIEQSHIDILEIGFLKNEPYSKDRTVFNSIRQIKALIPEKKNNIDYAAMIEVVNPIPLDMIEDHTEDGVDIIRVIVWKTKHDEKGNVVDALQEGFNYCKGIVEKGYKLCVQPARVDQYTDDEFKKMLKLFAKINPYAIYIVDSWGTQSAEQIMHYASIADEVLDKKVAIGYHGHNNMMQAFGNAVEFAKELGTRNIIIDASIYGIGRGAGNLNTEIITKYMNEQYHTNYDVAPMIELYELYIKGIYQKHIWGYCIPYFLTATYNCNPNYGEYYGIEKNMNAMEIEKVIKLISEDDRIQYSKEKAERYLTRYREQEAFGGWNEEI